MENNLQKARILKKTDGVCVLCGQSLSLQSMTIDHFIPKSLGGRSISANLFPCCEQCNKSKGDSLYSPDMYSEHVNMLYESDIVWLSKISRNTPCFSYGDVAAFGC